MKRRARVVSVALVIAAGLGLAAAAFHVAGLQGVFPSPSGSRETAPEFRGISAWINSPPLTMAGLRGRVVWIDFWTYSCVNCIRTLPFVRAMEDRYDAAGLEIVGVHSPEFSFEKRLANVREAVRRNGVSYPVALDNGMETWRVYRNHYWPHVYLVDVRGRIRFDFIGEGGARELEREVRVLLAESGARLPSPLGMIEPAVTQGITPEVYLGGARSGGEVSLRGWKVGDEFAEATAAEARADLEFSARDVFAVAAPSRGGTVRIHLLLDGRPVPVSDLGADAPGGVVTVDHDGLYRLLRLREPGRHRITLLAGSGARLYTFTFG